MFVQGKSRST